MTGALTLNIALSVTSGGTGTTTSTGTGSVVLSDSPAFTTSPTAPTQAIGDNSTKIATTAFVTEAVVAQNYKEAVKYASIAPLPSIVYANGSSGVGATLTGVALAAISLDSSSPSVNDRVLIKNQASDFQNGIYKVTATGSGIAVFVLTRATDFDQSSEINTGDSIFVTSGSTLSATTWAYTGIDAPTMGTTSLTFSQIAGQGSFTGGTGITITGTSIALTVPVTVALGGTNATSAGITAFNNITGYTAAGSTGTTSTNLVFSTSPVLVTPTLGAASATSLANQTFTTASGAMTFTPAAGSNFNIALSTTGDFVVNTNQLYVDTSAALVGIGTATPGGNLEILTDGAQGSIRFNRSTYHIWDIYQTTPGGGQKGLHFYENTAAVYQFSIAEGGKVGIGTGNPTSTPGFGRVLEISSATVGGSIQLTSTATNGSNFSLGSEVISSAAYLTFYSGANIRMSMDANGNFAPGANKTQNFGATGTRWATIFNSTNTTGTSRLTTAKTLCKYCAQPMVRGTGTNYIAGEKGDYIQVWCVACQHMAMEEISHLPEEKLAERKPAPKIIFKGCRVQQLSGNAKQVMVDFQYGDEEGALHNSTVLGEVELEDIKNMADEDRQAYLLDLGQREWDALEEIRLMKETVEEEQQLFDGLLSDHIGKDLLVK